MLVKIFITAFFLMSTLAYGGIFVEPYVGYLSVNHSGKFDNYGTDLDLPTDSANGMAYGGRLGYGLGMFGLGLDYMTSSLQENDKDFKSKITNMGATFVVGIPFFRAWAGYIFSSEYKLTDSSGSVDGTEKGKGYKVGLGFTPLPLISINLEYLMLSYDKADYVSFQDTTRQTKGILFSLSVPLTF